MSSSGAYLPLAMGTQKWHLLDRSVDETWHNGSVQFHHGGSHDGSDKIFNTVHAKKLKVLRICIG